MAGWNDVVSYVRSNYKVAVDEDRHIGLMFELDNLRTQTVHLWHAALLDGTEDWLQIESPFGKLHEGNIYAALERVGDMVCGGITVTGDYLMLRHSVPLQNVDINEIERPLRLITSSADALERALTGRDEY